MCPVGSWLGEQGRPQPSRMQLTARLPPRAAWTSMRRPRTARAPALAPGRRLCAAELGIDVGAILQKTKAILLHQMRSPHLQEMDMGGALLFLVLFSSLHLLVSRPRRWVVPRIHATRRAGGGRGGGRQLQPCWEGQPGAARMRVGRVHLPAPPAGSSGRQAVATPQQPSNPAPGPRPRRAPARAGGEAAGACCVPARLTPACPPLG